MTASFKMAHISDIHAGYKAGRQVNHEGVNWRELDGYNLFHEIVDEIIAEGGITCVLISGDLFHAPTPSIRSIVVVQEELRRLADAGIAVYTLAGNHDSSDVASDIAASRVIHDPARKIFSHVEPYVKHEVADGIFIHMVSHHMYEEQAATMSGIKPVPNAVNIFSTHGSCIDPILKMKLHTEQSPREIVIPDSLLMDSGWDYTMLGHIHERGWVGSKDRRTDTAGKKVYYNGSILRRGFSDADVPLGKGWTLWSIMPDGTFVADPRVMNQREQIDFDVIDAEKLSSTEITDLVLSNLRATQYDGVRFDGAQAPILRQTITNLSPAKQSSIDWLTITENTTHSLTWGIKTSQNTKVIVKDNHGHTHEQDLSETKKNVVEAFDSWRERSATLLKVGENIRDEVSKTARGHIQRGQEATLDDD